MPLPDLETARTVAVLSDTHVPDRQPRLPEVLLELLKESKPDQIFHCGDISTLEVIQQLEDHRPAYGRARQPRFHLSHGPAAERAH